MLAVLWMLVFIAVGAMGWLPSDADDEEFNPFYRGGVLHMFPVDRIIKWAIPSLPSEICIAIGYTLLCAIAGLAFHYLNLADWNTKQSLSQALPEISTTNPLRDGSGSSAWRCLRRLPRPGPLDWVYSQCAAFRICFRLP